MTLRILAFVLSAFVSSPPSAGGGSAPAQPQGAPEPAPANGTTPAPAPAPGAGKHAEVAPSPAEPTQATSQPAAVVDVVLPCGLRVITAKDASLPVAAVVLALEIGTRDDPEKLPGLVHALAYQLQQGSRELAPGEAIATAHDVGGLAAMAVGPAQVRFESLVPISQLDAQLRVEAMRMRAPNSGRELWLKSLSYARNDDGVKLLVPREAAAVAWQDVGMAHDGREVGKALGDMLDQAVSAQLARLYDYRLATLVVVGPEEPEALLQRIEPLFAGLSPRPRKAIAPAVTPLAAGAAPRVARVARQAGDSMVWAVPGNPVARAWAQVLCGTLNRQTRDDADPPKARVRCTFADDPRRPSMLVRVTGFEPAVGPEPLLAARLARIAAVAQSVDVEPELAALIDSQRERIDTELRYDLRTPLELATYLASAAERQGPVTGPRARDEILGLLGGSESDADNPASASDPADKATPTASVPTSEAAAALVAAIPALLDTRRAVLLLDDEQPIPPPVHSEAPPGTPTPAPAETPAAAGPTEPADPGAPE
jgi:hypothetical protein